MSTYLLGLLVFIQSLNAIITDDGANPSICENYKNVEEQFKCGPKGYPLNYGYKNCLIFTNKSTLENFSPKGQKFVGCSSLCLISALYNISQNSETCHEIQDKAFKSHVDCYLQCDFCDVCKSQKIALLKSYDWTDFMSMEAVRQVFAIVRQCGVFNCF